MSLILGINAFHADASACILRNGLMIAAAEEERFRRVKHWAGFPSEAIRYCLAQSGARLGDIDHVAINQDSAANLVRKLAYVAGSRPQLGLVLDRLKTKRDRDGAAGEFARAFPSESFGGRLHAVEHHIAHLSSAFHVSPFDEAALLSVDGFGDFASAAWGVGRGTEIQVERRIHFPHSLGIFYQAVTQLLGFPHYGDEYKVMGLAPYGEPTHLEAMRRVVRLLPEGGFELDLDCFVHHKQRISLHAGAGNADVANLWSPRLQELLGPARAASEPLTQRHKDIARSAQAMYEEAFFHILTHLQQRTGLTAVAIAGGCGMNSVANGKITRNTAFRDVYVQSAAGDAGGAIGAAFTVWHRLGGARTPAHDHAYWGPSFDDAEVADLLGSRAGALVAAGCEVAHMPDQAALVRSTAEAIARGDVVGWFQGRMEWGPRALGNRSILGDPRRADMKDRLNLKIKRRESFRPFAPSFLREAVPEWFELDGDVPFMMQVFPIRHDKRALIPAVAHVDGSGRLQTVTRTANPRYWALIQAFHDLTGVPAVLNTSFNENEPVVCTPAEALDCFLRTRMDRLVLGDRVITRAPA